VIPQALQNPEVLAALRRAAAAHNIPLERLTVGNARNSVNPETGAAEFSFGTFDMFDSFENGRPNAFDPTITLSGSTPPYRPPSNPGVGTAEIPTEPNGVKIESGIVQNPYSPPTAHYNPARYDQRLVPAREKDLERPEVKAFLDLVSQTEGAGFHTVLGTNQFPLGRLSPDLSQFPNRGPDNTKTASGAYQIQENTYDDLAGQMGLSGFDPQTQRLMGAQLLQRANGGKPGTESALEALRRGDYNAAATLAAPTWTSLPAGTEPNKNISADQARAYYHERLKLYRPQ